MTADTLDPLSAPPWAPRLHRMRYEPRPGRPGEAGAAELVALEPAPRWGALPPLPVAGPSPAVADEIADILRVALEVLDGRRPHTHLHGLFGPRAQRYWRAAAGRRDRSTTPLRLRRVLIDSPHAGVAEVAAVIAEHRRCRALPARFEHTTAHRWRCTDVRIL